MSSIGNEFYIYEWYFNNTGNVFYVGKGKGRRYRDEKGRNQKFTRYISKCDCSVRKVYENLTEKDAYAKEIELIAFYKSSGQCSCNFTIGGDAPPTHYGIDAPNRRSVIQLDLNGQYVKTWDYICQVEKELKILNNAIVRCCKNKRGGKSIGGFMWVYAEDYNPKNKYVYKIGSVSRPILQYDLLGNFIKEWESGKAASDKTGLRRSSLCSCCKGNYKSSGGYIWRYKIEVNYKDAN